MLSLSRMRLADLEAVLEIRNHPSTLEMLHHPQAFTLEECKKWFQEQRPQWLMVRDDNTILGYVRTSDWNLEERKITIGCDIHPAHRRKGYATQVYGQLLPLLAECGWRFVDMRVLKKNGPALGLYDKLGFRKAEETADDVRLMLRVSVAQKRPGDGKGVKVTACWFGDRRGRPTNSREALEMSQIMWGFDSRIDYGMPMDTLYVHNVAPSPPRLYDFYDEGVKWIRSLDGRKTPNGVVRVFERENIGLSFGAFSHAFRQFRQEYGFWLFGEDDQIIMRDGVMGQAMSQLMLPAPKTGFVATAGVCPYGPQFPPHCHGGCGVSTREVIGHVCENNFSKILQTGCLPYWHNDGTPGYGADYTSSGEIEFTNIFHRLGFKLDNIEMDDIIMSWQEVGRRNPRVISWRFEEIWMPLLKKLDERGSAAS